jgi:hypothetical protein
MLMLRHFHQCVPPSLNWDRAYAHQEQEVEPIACRVNERGVRLLWAVLGTLPVAGNGGATTGWLLRVVRDNGKYTSNRPIKMWSASQDLPDSCHRHRQNLPTRWCIRQFSYHFTVHQQYASHAQGRRRTEAAHAPTSVGSCWPGCNGGLLCAKKNKEQWGGCYSGCWGYLSQYCWYYFCCTDAHNGLHRWRDGQPAGAQRGDAERVCSLGYAVLDPGRRETSTPRAKFRGSSTSSMRSPASRTPRQRAYPSAGLLAHFLPRGLELRCESPISQNERE